MTHDHCQILQEWLGLYDDELGTVTWHYGMDKPEEILSLAYLPNAKRHVLFAVDSESAIRCCIGKVVQHNGECAVICLREFAIRTYELGEIVAIGIAVVHQSSIHSALNPHDAFCP